MPRLNGPQGITILLGLAILLWVPFEDSGTIWVRLFGVLVCILAALTASARIPASMRQRWYTWPLVGLIAGLLVTPAAFLLMAFKSGMHGHGNPEFTPAQVSAVLNTWPIWALAGLLAGFAAATWQRVR